MSSAGVRCAVLLAAALACGPATGPVTEPPPPLVPLRTPPGTPIAAATGGTVSSAGGSVATPDGAIRITAPPGAVPDGTELTITPISSTARGAVGGAFRLGPEGVTFLAPVTLTFAAPESYPAGSGGLAGVGVEHQDARGYWHRVEPVVRDAGANTVRVTTNHFSDWTLTWQTGTPAAEGPVLLEQTVGIPFTASGNVTLHFQGDDAYDTVYVLTGSLTVPDSIPYGDETCVPDATTKTLPLNVAELHRSDPPAFRWGLGVFWTLSCSIGGVPSSTRLLPAMFDTMQINLTRCPGAYDPGQIATATHLQGAYTKDCGVDGTVRATWDLRGCVDELECLGEGGCTGLTACTDGVQSCVCSTP